VAQQEVVKTVDVAGHENGHPRDFVGKADVPFHPETFRERSEGLLDPFPGDGEPGKVPFDAHEEDVSRLRRVLGRVKNVSLVLKDETGDGCDDALLVGAG